MDIVGQAFIVFILYLDIKSASDNMVSVTESFYKITTETITFLFKY